MRHALSSIALRSRPASRATFSVAALAWIAVGLVGLFRYLDAYYLYRGFPPPVAPAGMLQRRTFLSPSLHVRRGLDVYLPPGYRAAVARGRQFPVVYLLHGHPGRPEDFFKIADAHVVEDALLARRRVRPMILVAPSGLSARFGTLTEWADTRAGPFERYVVDVVHYVDAHYATKADRRHRVLAGLSEGAFGAANVALHHLGVFGGFQSWSGYFIESPRGPLAGAPPAVLRANSPLLYVARLAPRIRRAGLRAYVYSGLEDRAASRQTARFAGALRATGASVRLSLFRGGHDWALWRRETPHMLAVADSWFAAADRRSVRRRS